MTNKERQQRNRQLLTFIRRGLLAQEELFLCKDGYKTMLEQASQIIDYSNQGALKSFNKDEISQIVKDANRVQKYITHWVLKMEEAIEADPEKYVPLYLMKWKGLDYIYSYETFGRKTLTYRPFHTKGDRILVIAHTYLKNIKKVIKATNQARETLIQENLPMIYQIARKNAGSRTDLIEDLVSVGYIQFILCMDRTFDMARGTEFSTHVYTCISSKCRETVMKYDEMINIPSARMKDKNRAFKGLLDIDANDLENVSEKKRQKEAEIRRVISHSSNYYSLDYDYKDNDDDKMPMDLFISDRNTMLGITSRIDTQQIIDRIRDKIMSSADKRKIIRLKALEYSGDLDFTGDIPHYTLEEVAEKLYQHGYVKNLITKERARQLIFGGKKLVRRQILNDPEFAEELGLVVNG
jgi:RNA polymerase sigma factor (sigma-70 family)